MESEGLVDVVLPDDAPGVVVPEPGLTDVGQIDIHILYHRILLTIDRAREHDLIQAISAHLGSDF